MTIQRTAYLVAHIYTDPTGRMHPQVHAVRIYSESATSLSYIGENAAAVDVYHAKSDDYQSAADFLRFCVQTMKPFAWCLPLMEQRDRREIQLVTFSDAAPGEALRAHAVVQEFLATSPEHAAKVLVHGTYMDADRYDMLRDAFEEAKIGVAVLWDAKSEAA